MLDKKLKPLRFDQWDKESWERYSLRVGVPADGAEREFFRQVVYDHFDHHNECYPGFNISDYNFEIVSLTVSEVNEKVRYFNGENVEALWSEQYDWFEQTNPDYIIYKYMANNGTPPFPPVLMDATNLKTESRDSWRECGEPLHLIEGTHRTSYLIHMANRGLIEWDSQHEFVLLTPRINKTQSA